MTKGEEKRSADCAPFPVQGDGLYGPSKIPLWLAEIAYKGYTNRFGRETQALKRIGERGGFSREEVVEYIRYPERR